MSDYKFNVKGLDLYYGDFHALKDINMEIKSNMVTAFIGPSGCGKSTFLKTLNRMNDLVDNCKITGDVLLCCLFNMHIPSAQSCKAILLSFCNYVPPLSLFYDGTHTNIPSILPLPIKSASRIQTIHDVPRYTAADSLHTDSHRDSTRPFLCSKCFPDDGFSFSSF